MRSQDPDDQEAARLAALTLYNIVPDGNQAEFQTIIDLAAHLFDVPTVLVSFVEKDRQIFAARRGLAVCETGRSVSFCAHGLDRDEVLVVPDATLDPRFRDNPLVTGEPGIRFYAGAPLRTPAGLTLGRLCLIDSRPRAAFTGDNRRNLAALAALVFDRLEMRRLDQARSASQLRFEHVAATSPDGIICADHHGAITFWNGAAERLFGYAPEEAMGRDIGFILSPRLRAKHGRDLARFAREGTADGGSTAEVVACRKDGTEFPIESSLSVWYEAGRAKFGLIVRDVSDRRANEERLFRLAHLDALTDLPNRMAWRGRLEEVVRHATPASVMILDLDGFKEINDTLGHSVGDRLLCDVAARLRACVGPADMVARLSGDEFAVLRGKGEPLAAARTADAIIAAVSDPFDVGTSRISLSVSVGIALFPHDGTNAEDLMSSADLALYQAKAEGRCCRRFFVPDLRNAAVRRSTLSLELARAAAAGEFELFYQPQLRGTDGRLTGAEALLRWRHPERGLQAPVSFLSTLENGLLAASVGRWVVQTACHQAAAWRQALPEFRMGVNLFGVQVRSGDLAASVRAALAAAHLPAHALELEITENIVLHHDESVIQRLRELKREGVGIAFDDYGTGYASLSLLKRYPLTRLKIDRGFVHHMCGSPEDAAIVRAVISLGRSFGLNVIAEGVETEAQRDLLVAEGCVDHQGFLYGRPMAAAEFAERFGLASRQPARRIA